MSIGTPTAPSAPKKVSRFSQIKPYLAPLLITVILVVGDINYGILQSQEASIGGDVYIQFSLTGLAIACSVGLEIVLSYFATGRFPHLASAYITGISVGILVQTPAWWPFVVCSFLSISSKYALRIAGRALWNPSNLGVSVLLFLVPTVMAPLSDQWGNNIWPICIIMFFGTAILFTLGRLHITFAYAAAYAALTVLRTAPDWHRLNVELALMTAPSYMLFMIFMITDPKTTTRTWQRQCVVAVLVALVETLLRLARETHAPYYALFITAPITNLIEIWWESRTSKCAPASQTQVPASAASPERLLK